MIKCCLICRALLAALNTNSNFHANGFPAAVYESDDFVEFSEWISNCENIEPPNLQRLEQQPNALPAANIEEHIKRCNVLDARYEKLLRLSAEKSLLHEHIDYCDRGLVAEFAQKDRLDVGNYIMCF